MKKHFTLLFTILLVFSIISCQKELESLEPSTTGNTTNNGNNNIIGTWKFIQLEATTLSTIRIQEGSDISKTVTESNYTTENNTGTVVIDATTLHSKNFSYSVNTIAKAKVYDNGALIDSFSLPFQAAVPSVSSTATYTKVGADSVYFQSGSSFTQGITQSLEPGGSKIKFEQDKLFFTQSVDKTTTQDIQGATVTSIVQAIVVVTLQRQ